MRIFQGGATGRRTGLGGFGLRKLVAALFGLLLLAAAWRAYGWQGLVAVFSGLVLWGLLHVTRLLRVLQRSARRPVGYLDSAVMLHAKLKAGVPLLHVMALTRSLGEPLSAEGEEPQWLCWTDAGRSQLRCEFVSGRLRSWQLLRPEEANPSDLPPEDLQGPDSRAGAGS
jgi:hypothetical protein